MRFLFLILEQFGCVPPMCMRVWECLYAYLAVCIQCVSECVCVQSDSCIVLYEEDCSLLWAVHQRVFKVMDEPLLQRSVGKTEKQSHRVTTATISQMV